MKQLIRLIGISTILALLLGLGTQARAAGPDLDISSSQKDQLKALASHTRDRTSRERDALRQARTELMRVYSTYGINYGKLKTTWEKIGSAQMSLLNIHLDNEVAIRNILKQEQFKTLRSMMKRRLRDREVHFVAPPEIDVLDRWPDERMLDDLKVSEEKRKLLQPDPAKEKTTEELRRTTKQLLELYSNYDLDTAAAKKLIGTIHRKQTLLLLQQTRRQRLVRAVLTQEQFKELQQQIRKKIAERESKPWPKPKNPSPKHD